MEIVAVGGEKNDMNFERKTITTCDRKYLQLSSSSPKYGVSHSLSISVTTVLPTEFCYISSLGVTVIGM